MKMIIIDITNQYFILLIDLLQLKSMQEEMQN